MSGYARTSTDGQTLAAQLEPSKAAGCEKVFPEKPSGARLDLVQFLKGIDSEDLLIVSRLVCSTRDLRDIFGASSERGAAFRPFGDQWASTTTPRGRSMLAVLGGLAACECALILARTGEGRIRAKTRGVHMDRLANLSPHQWREAQAELAGGTATPFHLARRPNVSQSTMSRLADKATAPTVPAVPVMDVETERATRLFLDKIKGRYPVHEAFLFGSRARRTHRPDSDADVAVVLRGEHGNRYRLSGDMAETAFDVMLETGILVQAVPLWEDEMQSPETFSNPLLIENIKRDGLRL